MLLLFNVSSVIGRANLAAGCLLPVPKHIEPQGDLIRIGCCTGHEWEVKSVAVVPNGKGKCRIALTEMYSHAKVSSSFLPLLFGCFVCRCCLRGCRCWIYCSLQLYLREFNGGIR